MLSSELYSSRKSPLSFEGGIVSLIGPLPPFHMRQSIQERCTRAVPTGDSICHNRRLAGRAYLHPIPSHYERSEKFLFSRDTTIRRFRAGRNEYYSSSRSRSDEAGRPSLPGFRSFRPDGGEIRSTALVRQRFYRFTDIDEAPRFRALRICPEANGKGR